MVGISISQTGIIALLISLDLLTCSTAEKSNHLPIKDTKTNPKTASHSPKSLAIGILNNCTTHCGCKDVNHCNPSKEDFLKLQKRFHPTDKKSKQRPIITMVSKTSQTYEDWNWNSIDIVLTENPHILSRNVIWDLLCYSHASGKLYGYIVKLSGRNSANLDIFENYTVIENFLSKELHFALCSYTTTIALDFLDVFRNKSDSFTVEKFSFMLATVKETMRRKLPREVLICTMPWLPCESVSKCSTTDELHAHPECVGIVKALNDYCDYVFLNPDSFSWATEHDCQVRPIFSYVKQFYAIEIYSSLGLNKSKIVVSIMWHSMDHECYTYDKETNTCMYDRQKNSSCLMRFTPRSLWAETRSPHSNSYSQRYQQQYYIYTANNKTHQVWVENDVSLVNQYGVARSFGLGGVAIWSGDDVIVSKSNHNQVRFNKRMWESINREVVGDTSLTFPTHAIAHDIAGHIAGAIIGSLILGGIIGAFVVFCGIRYGRRSPLRPPFRKDVDQFMDEPEI